ncbi:MAG: endonuclease domain-containing protein [Polyangiaceae bacterium]|nr:endonuclease domain-containing protein [Polyangiaceae bacterium]
MAAQIIERLGVACTAEGTQLASARVDIQIVERALRRETFFARQHRNRPTPAEAALWQLLRRGQLDGFKFRRQFPVGPYFADFFCVRASLAVELDGPSHSGRERRDRLRDTFFRKRGIRVLRVANHDALLRPTALLQQIRALLQAGSPLTK